MPVKIRLRRVGAKKRPMYRLVVADSHSPRDGRFVETIGHYNPLTDPETVNVKVDRARLWLERGAQPTEAVERLLRKTGVLPARTEQTSQATQPETPSEASTI